MNCRICDSNSTIFVDVFWPYEDYKAEVFDCHSCGCRFVAHDPDAHEKLHSNPSSYIGHAIAAKTAKRWFDQGCEKKLSRLLSKSPKNKFVIDFIKERNSFKTIAEIGCSLGYLTSYFILSGYKIRGFDVSKNAVMSASRNFGDHFSVINESTLKYYAPYDAIYHVGTIGCVANPIAMTNDLLGLLRPGGWLLFNSPNRRHIDQNGEIWLNTPPPDLVTIFPRKFWDKFPASLEQVITKETYMSQGNKLISGWIKHNRAINKRRIVGDQYLNSGRQKTLINRLVDQLIRGGLKLALGQFQSGTVEPFGVYVAMQKSLVHDRKHRP